MTLARDRGDTSAGRIVIVPNRSLSLKGLVVFFATITVVTLLVAGWFTLLGMWPVMAYALAELIALALSFQAYLRRAQYAEVITISPERVILEHRSAGRQNATEFNRYWATVEFVVPDSPLRKTRLLIRSHGNYCEVGACLTDAEKRSLHERLRDLIGAVGCVPAPGNHRAGIDAPEQSFGHNR